MPQPESPCCNVLITAEAAICLPSRKVYNEQSFGSSTQANHLRGFTAFLYPAIPVFSSFFICAVCILIYRAHRQPMERHCFFFPRLKFKLEHPRRRLLHLNKESALYSEPVSFHSLSLCFVSFSISYIYR